MYLTELDHVRGDGKMTMGYVAPLAPCILRVMIEVENSLIVYAGEPLVVRNGIRVH